MIHLKNLQFLNTFSVVRKIGILIFTFFLIPFISISQTIEKFSIDSGGAAVTVGNLQVLYTIGEVNVREFSSVNIKVSEGYINPDFKVNINPKLFLQGPMLSPTTVGLMNDNLRSSGYLPTVSPYADNATANASVYNVTGNNAIVDWVWVELRDVNNNQTLINGKSAFVQRDGDVVALDGTSPVIMNASQNIYFVVVKHRNHLGAMTANFIGLSKTPVTVDFTNPGFPTYGGNAQAVLSTGKKALWGGDVTGNGITKFSGTSNDVNAIKDFIIAFPSNSLHLTTYSATGYRNEDVDLNGVSRFSGSPNDSNRIKDIIVAHPNNTLQLPTFTINSTVPSIN